MTNATTAAPEAQASHPLAAFPLGSDEYNLAALGLALDDAIARRRAFDTDGLDAVTEECRREVMFAAERAIEAAINATPATTLAGLRIKARAAVWMNDMQTAEDALANPRPEISDVAVVSLLRDLLAMNEVDHGEG